MISLDDLFKKPDKLQLVQNGNVFLIDWLTFVTFVDDVDSVKRLLGLDDPSIPWTDEVKFRNGYPLQCYWGNITISHGADRSEFYKSDEHGSADSKVRTDMGICVNLSGQGCRNFETYGHGDWNKLFAAFFSGAKYNITRLDLAYDDHTGVLDIHKIEEDTRDRAYVTKAKYAEVVWSDNQNTDIQGMTVQIGSDKSRTLIRIYDKAAERGYKDMHWVRCEIQLRKENAAVACAKLFELRHIGKVASGILRNYVTYRVPTSDSNKSRWPIAGYWDRLILDMERISLWITPGDEYNFSRTERWLVGQCGQALLTAMKMHRLSWLLKQIEKLYPELLPKYQRAIEEYQMQRHLDRGLPDTEYIQDNLFDDLPDDPGCPW